MNAADLVSVTSRPYSSLLQEISISGKLFVSKQLSFDMQAQIQSFWCWAATATSVSHFYCLWSTWTQCRVVNAELGKSDCCNSTVPSPCNIGWSLAKALMRTKNLASEIEEKVSFQRIRDEIDAGRPVGARIGWNRGGGHFMVIYGYSTVLGVEYFDIDDPIYRKIHLPVSEFSSNYQGSGRWTHTYFTKSDFKMPYKPFIPKESILRRIFEVRPLLDIKKDMMFTGGMGDAMRKGRVSLGLAHHLYSMGLDSLLNQEHDMKPLGLRVYELLEDKPQAFFDVSEEDQPQLLQMSTSDSHLKPFSTALEQAIQIAEENSQETEMRIFRVPALNFEALWLSYEGEAKDMLVPLRTVEHLTAYKAVTLDEALDVLRETARSLGEMDDTMGA
jgi:hypothetical protein